MAKRPGPPGSEIIIAGFHRSGTSSVAQLLHAAGLFLGEELIGAMPYNPYGHFEDREVVRIHDQILRASGLNWQADQELIPAIHARWWETMVSFVERRRTAHRLWGFKDPRVCLFLPVWKHLMPSCKVLITYRRVGDCSFSLLRRHARELFTASGPADVHERFFTDPDLAPRMWLAHNRALVAFARHYPDDVLVISYASLLRGLPLTTLLRTAWRSPLRDVPTFSAVDPLAATERDHRQPLADAALIEQLDSVHADLRELEQQTLMLVDGPQSALEPARAS